MHIGFINIHCSMPQVTNRHCQVSLSVNLSYAAGHAGGTMTEFINQANEMVVNTTTFCSFCHSNLCIPLLAFGNEVQVWPCWCNDFNKFGLLDSQHCQLIFVPWGWYSEIQRSFSFLAFKDLWLVVKLSVSAGAMLW